MASLGQILREAREQQGYSLEEVEKATRIGKRYLAALEAEDYGKLPSPVYVRGFVRLYAQHLGLEVESVLALYPERFSRGTSGLPPPPALGRPSRPVATWAVIVLFLAAVASIGFFLYRGGILSGKEGGELVVQVPTTTPTPGPSPNATSPTGILTPGGTATATASKPGSTATSPATATVTAPSSSTPGSTGSSTASATASGTATASSTSTPASTVTPSNTAVPAVVVPFVVGQDYEQARAALQSLGLQVQRSDATQDGAPANQVLAQSPPAGSQLRAGQMVVLTVNSVTKKVAVPDVVRLPEPDAKQRLQAAGLKVNPFTNYQKLSDVPWAPKDICVGCVLSTTPGGGTLVDPGTEVSLAVRSS
ncbi:MAG: PASTA domain-containing protein [Chloroflexi bacterium]|nr:PASTA domain-containing protein [Chloroflexota bacterium]